MHDQMTLRQVLEIVEEIVEDYPEMLDSVIEVEVEDGTEPMTHINAVETNNGSISFIINDVFGD